MYRFSFAALLLVLTGCGVSYTEVPVETTTVELNAPGMDCEMCAATLMTKFREMPGVIDVTADAGTKVVTLTVAKDGGMDEQAAVDAVAEMGYGPTDEESAEGAAADEATAEPEAETT